VISSQQHTSDQPLEADTADFTNGASNSSSSRDVDVASSKNDLVQRNSLTLAELAGLGASNNSTNVFQQNAVRTLRSELNADAVLIIDYVDAFGAKTVRALSGIEQVVANSDIWLPDWLSPVDLNSPMKLIDVAPSQFNAISALGARSEYRSALAIAIPGTTGTAGMIIALSIKPIDFDDVQIDKAKTIASLLSLSASRSNARSIAQRGESQLAASRLITRSVVPDSGNSGTPAEFEKSKSLLTNISDQLRGFFEFDVIAVRVEIEGKFATRDSLSADQNRNFVIPASDPGTASRERSIEARAVDYSVALANAERHGEIADQRHDEAAWKSVGIESVLAIPIISPTPTAIVLGSTRSAAYPPEAIAVANRFVPALTAAIAAGSSEPVEANSIHESRSGSGFGDFVESVAASTDLLSACGVIATQITNRTDATRVQIGFIDDESGRAQTGFDTASAESSPELTWVAPDEIANLVELDSDESSGQRYSNIRVPIKVSDRTIGFVEATREESGFDESDLAQIKEITLACATVVGTLRQLEQSQRILDKLELLRRVTEQIRSDNTGDPINNPRIASLVRNLFDADWIYFGSVDHENDHSTTEITDGLDVPELAPGVRVSRRSLLIPSTLAPAKPVTIDLESAAPGQRAAGRWMYRAGLRSAVCAPLRLNGVVTTMFMCASRKPTGFGSLEKKMAATIISELEISIERAYRADVAVAVDKGSTQTVLEQLGPSLEAILNNASALILTLDKDGIVTDVAGRGIEGLKLVPERLMGRDFIAYSRKIEGLEEALTHALNGHSGRIEIEVFGTILDVWMEPITSSNGETGSATVVVSDITDRVTAARAESALLSMRDEKDRASKFIVSLSHEMKSPLTTVVALADLLVLNERGNLHPDQIERINVVQQNADRLTLLVNDFLNISKMEAGTFESNPSKFQIAELAYDLETSFEPIATGQDHKLSVTAPDENQFATADRELLRQAIMNLLTNASKYSPPNTNVSLDIWVDENDLRITVTDEGPGIPRDERDRVFEPYSQLDNQDIFGNGMGLAIVRQIVELHHGKVWVEDGVGGGTSFAIWLPAAVSTS
jgi:signal transduction histidine kinase